MMPLIDETGNTYGRWTVVCRGPDGGKSPRPRWKCVCECGNVGFVDGRTLRKGQSRSCGCLARDSKTGANNPAWKGGRTRASKGYIKTTAKEHPRADKYGYVLEHILVMERVLGRALKEGETVHHKNGIRDDNQPDNLELWVGNHPPGQRVEDMLEWARGLIAEYKNFEPMAAAGAGHDAP